MNNIIFSKASAKKGFMCIDMHCHTEHSDGASSVDEILTKIRKKNIGVAITDHTRISGCVEIFKKKKKTDLVIPGIEVMSKQGFDVLFYFNTLKKLEKFFQDEIKNNSIDKKYYNQTTISLEDIVKLRKKYDCVVSLAHPYGYAIRAKPLNIEKHDTVFKYVDAIEVINGGNNHSLNVKAVELHKKQNRGITGGSDGHSIFAIGDVLTCSKAKNITEFLNNIKNKKNIVIGRGPYLGRSVFFLYYFAHKILKKCNLMKH